ncbi:hypothetical protein Tco_0475579 [Tanacetum coccineum]
MMDRVLEEQKGRNCGNYKEGWKGTSRDKEGVGQAANASYSKGRRNSNGLPVTKERDNQCRTVHQKKQGAYTNSLCNSSPIRNGDSLHFDGENGAKIGPNKSEDLRAIGLVGDRVEDISHFISSERRSKRSSSRKVFNERRSSVESSGKGTNEASGTKEGPREQLVPRPRSWRLHIKRDTNKEGSGVGLVLIDPEEKEYSHVIRLKFHASEDNMNYEALLVGLADATGRQMKDLHVFVNSKLLVD